MLICNLQYISNWQSYINFLLVYSIHLVTTLMSTISALSVAFVFKYNVSEIRMNNIMFEAIEKFNKFFHIKSINLCTFDSWFKGS